jgi:predicted  nucleic acid-binding Zn-ribbon protein
MPQGFASLLVIVVEVIQDTCARQFRRHPDERHPAASSRERKREEERERKREEEREEEIRLEREGEKGRGWKRRERVVERGLYFVS